jgi:hypothetical protein
MPNATVRASATALPISTLTRDPVLQRALSSPGREPPLAAAVVDRKPAPRLSGGAVRVLELVES